MSRAFVKEDDRDAELLPQRPQRQHPYYVTPQGYQDLQSRLAEAEAAANARLVEDILERVEAAIVVNPAERADDAVHFGASVTVEDPQKKKSAYQIVGEDEADPATGTISWLSPLAQALLEHRAGDRVIWERPAGNLPLRIVTVSYE